MPDLATRALVQQIAAAHLAPDALAAHGGQGCVFRTELEASSDGSGCDAATALRARLLRLLDAAHELSEVVPYEHEDWMRRMQSNPLAVRVRDLPIRLTTRRTRDYQEGLRLLNAGAGTSALYRQMFTAGCAHAFTEPEFAATHLLHTERAADSALERRLWNYQAVRTNLFFGAQNTQTRMHLDSAGGLGHILNEGGCKLFLLAPYAELRDPARWRRVFGADAAPGTNGDSVDPEELARCAPSYRWCVLRHDPAVQEWIYWPATTFHAVFNLADSAFVSLAYQPAAPLPTREWIECALRPGNRDNTRRSPQALLELLSVTLARAGVFSGAQIEALLQMVHARLQRGALQPARGAKRKAALAAPSRQEPRPEALAAADAGHGREEPKEGESVARTRRHRCEQPRAAARKQARLRR